MGAPQSIIYICSGVRLNNRYDHTIHFDSIQGQRDYFAGKVVKTFSAYSYLRKTWPIRVEATMEQAKTWTYLYFRNGTGKYYYYFIDRVEYINDNTVELTLDLDVLQTYLFDFELLPCFVERQHTETDYAYEHTLDEGLEVGELMDHKVKDTEELKDLCILILATINPNYLNTGTPVDALGYMYDNVFSGLTVWAVDASNWAEWSKQIEGLSEAGFIDGIVAMWMYPKNLVKLYGGLTWESYEEGELCKNVTGTDPIYTTAPGPNAVTNSLGYRNRKMYCYPYHFLYATNNQGGSAVYRYERIGSKDFLLHGSLSPDGAVKVSPRWYNDGTGLYDDKDMDKEKQSYDYGLTLTGFPSCAWDADVYKLWLAQNQNQQQHATDTATLTMTGGALTALVSASMGNVGGAVGGAGAFIAGAQQIGALNAQKADMSIQPPQSRGAFSTNVNTGAGKQTFTFIWKGVTPEQGKIIDDYFTMYGYKLHEVRTPNINARPCFTYVKTVGCHIKGDLCNEDQTKIEAIFDKGVTWWKNGDKVCDYSQDNRV